MRRYLRGGRTEPADAAARRLLREKEPVREAGLMCVPLAIYGERIGAIMVESPRVSPRGLAPARRAPARDAFGAEDLSLLEAIASLAATALENARLYALANIDGLTGLYCRRYFDQRVAEEVERARRFGTTFALVLLDLDDFKQLNDTFGHVAGDRALREVAAIAASQLRGVDLAARYGGEELAFLLPRTSLIDAQPVAERIRDAVASHLFSENGEIRRITASIGVAGWAESGVDDPQSLVARADASLYRAKHAGKNRVEIDLVGFDIGPSLAPILRRRA
jgi:diguanylate cyclase (GGDEF)-like protein